MFPLERDSERRKAKRFALTGAIPGVFKGQNIHVVPVDVSINGLGLLMDPAPEPFTTLELQLEAPLNLTLRFQLRWCLPREEFASISGLDELKRCGLILLDDYDLVAVFSNYECLQIEE